MLLSSGGVWFLFHFLLSSGSYMYIGIFLLGSHIVSGLIVHWYIVLGFIECNEMLSFVGGSCSFSAHFACVYSIQYVQKAK